MAPEILLLKYKIFLWEEELDKLKLQPFSYFKVFNVLQSLKLASIFKIGLSKTTITVYLEQN
ncbi:hypothetical protein BLOT_016493 [Blomia tropicalis]|nr:hypothetical protein BLOT_016493 [Blomia tropicalis]